MSTIKGDVFANLDNLNVLNLSHNRFNFFCLYICLQQFPDHNNDNFRITMIGERSLKNLNNLRALR